MPPPSHKKGVGEAFPNLLKDEKKLEPGYIEKYLVLHVKIARGQVSSSVKGSLPFLRLVLVCESECVCVCAHAYTHTHMYQRLALHVFLGFSVPSILRRVSHSNPKLTDFFSLESQPASGYGRGLQPLLTGSLTDSPQSNCALNQS